jgi:hypothetical protein
VPLLNFETALSGTTLALRPELAGTVVEDVYQQYHLADGAGIVQNRVVRSDVDGTLDFYWRIISTPSLLADPIASGGEVTAFRVAGFTGYARDADWRADDVGNAAPRSAINFNGEAVNFLFDPGLEFGDESRFFFIDTRATAYAKVGYYDLLAGPSGPTTSSFDTFAPVPEPTSVVLFALAALGLASTFALRERRCAFAYQVLIAMNIVAFAWDSPAGGAMLHADDVAQLIAAIEAANQSPEPDTITLVAGRTYTLTALHNETIGSTGLPTIAAGSALSLLGNGGVIERSTAAETPRFRLFDVDIGASLALENLTLQGGLAWDVGGAIYNAGNLSLTRVTVQHNITDGFPGSTCFRCGGGGRPSRGGPGRDGKGGGIYSAGSLLLENSTLENNQVRGGTGGLGFDGRGRGGHGRGGGLYVAAGTSATLLNSIVTGNAALGGFGVPDGAAFGGGIYIGEAIVNLDECTVSHATNNTASTSHPNIYGPFQTIPNLNPIPGDFNHDGSVDAADYVVWRKNFSGDQAMYDAWRASFGASLGVGAASRAAQSPPRLGGPTPTVPEPAALALAALALALLVVRRKSLHRRARSTPTRGGRKQLLNICPLPLECGNARAVRAVAGPAENGGQKEMLVRAAALRASGARTRAASQAAATLDQMSKIVWDGSFGHLDI